MTAVQLARSRSGGSLDMARLAGVGWYGTVFYTKIAQRSSRLQVIDFKRLVRASGIFDSHRPLPSLGNASQ